MTEHIFHPPTTKRRPSPWAILAAFLLNLLLALILLYVNYQWRKEAEKLAQQQQAVQVELVPQAQQPPPPPPPQQQQQQQQQAQKEPEKQPEKEPEKKPEKEPEKKPEKEPEKKPPEKQPEKQQTKPAPPQLQQAQIKDKSTTDRKDAHNGGNGESIAIAMGPGPMISLSSPKDGTRGPEGSRGPIGEELSQSEQDFVLAQILPYWKVDTHRPEGKGMVLEAILEINADGTFLHPLNYHDAWNPEQVIANYAELSRLGYSYRRQALEGFLEALRLSQPIKVPPGGKWPKWMKLRFAFDDL